MIIYPERFGAVGDGIADDTEALQKSIDHWTNSSDHLLYLGNRYRITRPLETRITSNITEIKILRGYGGVLIDDFDADAPAKPLLNITVRGSGYLWRNLHIYDLNIVSGDTPRATTYLRLDGGRDAFDGYEALYSFDVVGTVIDGAPVHGVIICGNAFEGQLTGGRVESSRSKNGYGVWLFDGVGASGAVSSIYLDKFTVYGFNTGIFNAVGDVRITNVTVLKAQRSGIQCTNNISGVVQNCHVENNCLARDQHTAGIIMDNVCRSINNYGLSNEGYQKYVVQSYSNQPSNLIIGGFNQGITDTHATISGDGQFELIGVPSYNANGKVGIKTNKNNRGLFSRIFGF